VIREGKIRQIAPSSIHSIMCMTVALRVRWLREVEKLQETIEEFGGQNTREGKTRALAARETSVKEHAGLCSRSEGGGCARTKGKKESYLSRAKTSKYNGATNT